MATPKISVIIPIYGTEKYLDKCLRSVREQTFKEIEIICIDDCSPDNSFEIVEKHIKQDGRIRLIRHKKNLGLGGARNTAIRAAKAEYIASVDSDDHMSPNMLETLWNATDNGWFDIICCGYNRIDKNDNLLSKVEYEEKQISNDDNNIDIFTALNPAFWNKLWRKSLFVDNDIFFPEHDFYEDMSTTPRILAKSHYVKVISDCLYRYLIRDQSIMNTISDKNIIDYLKGFEIIYIFLQENDLLERYRIEFHHFIRGNFLFYSKSILNSELIIDKKNQYLRLLILFRITFTENYNKFNKFDMNGLLSYLNEADLHGTYFDKHQNALYDIKKKESLIERHKDKIESDRKTILGLKKGLSETESSLEKNKTELKSTLHTLENKEVILREKLNEINIKRQQLDGQKNQLEEVAEKINQLEEEVAEKISFAQMLAVFLFATLTYLVMSKKQTTKLINKPKMFFRDSKSGFAKKYASLFDII